MPPPIPSDHIDQIAAAIHYPECWDTMAYPTLEEALIEVTGTFQCSNDQCARPSVAASAGVPEPRKWPHMGYGNVAIGGGRQPDGTPCLLYMEMGEAREIDADTSDLFPVGSEVDPKKLLACVYFKDGAAMQQTIEVLQEMQAEIGFSPDSPAAPADAAAKDAERYRWIRDVELQDWIDLYHQNPANIDAAIDAAMQRKESS